MKKLLLLVTTILFVFTLAGCTNRSEKFNNVIEDYESPANYVLYDRDKYIKQGVEYPFEDIANDLVESEDLRSNSKPYINNHYVVGNHLYFQFTHYLTSDGKGETGAHDQSLVVIDLTTDAYELIKTFTDIPGDNTMALIGLVDETYYTYRIENQVFVTNIKTDEILYEVTLDFSIGKGFDYKDGKLYVFKDHILTVFDVATQSETQTTINETYNELDVSYPYLVFKYNTNPTNVFHLDTATTVTLEDYRAYQENFQMLYYRNAYERPLILEDEIEIGNLTLILEGAKKVVPILMALNEADTNNQLFLHFTEYRYIDEHSFYIGITHDRSGMLTWDKLYTMMFKYELEGDLTYIGYFKEAIDVKVIELN